jgi:putative ABC transport system ATP-binding protein
MIQLNQVSKHYRLGQVDVTALNAVSLSVRAGEVVGLSGASGSGKTTLLNLIGLMDFPTTGQLIWQGQDTATLSNSDKVELRRNQLGVVFQHFNLNPVLTAYENIEYPLLLIGMKDKARAERVNALLSAIGLEAQAQQKPDQLSGGQRQRVAIARALAKKPAVIIADEPTAALDSHNRQHVLALMKSLCQQEGATLIMATHDADSLAFCERVISMADGVITHDSQSVQGGN